ncbi:hypothetical protein CsSME_00015462 [Camellia sinensis var. sinensis]
MSSGDYPGRAVSLDSWGTFRMQGRRAMSVSPYFSRRCCISGAEEMIRTEIRKAETKYSRYTREQKRSLVRRCLQFLSRAMKKVIRIEQDDQRMDFLMHQALTTRACRPPPTPAKSHASSYQELGNHQPMNMEQSPEQQGANPAYPIEVSSEHNPPSPMYTPCSPDQATDFIEEDPEENFDWSGNEN